MFCGAGQKNQDDLTPDDNKKIENYIYKPSNRIGQGNFSQVYKGVEQNTGIEVAIKVVNFNTLTSKIAQQLLKNQITILKQVNHENIIKCHDVLVSKNNCYIVTDYYSQGDLQKQLFKRKYFKQHELPKIIYEIYQGLLYLNQNHIVHRDFKPANIFISQYGTMKIADFGFAIKSHKPFKDINIGSPIYMSPQGLLLHEYGPKTQVWAFGVMIYELLHGETPLSRCKDQKQLKQKILLPAVFREGLSSQIRKMVDLCLTVDPKHRIEMKDIAKTNYMSQLINYFQNQKLQIQIHSQTINKDLLTTKSSNHNQSKIMTQISKQVRLYQQGLALLQYCRLLHKTTQETPSFILSQWLLQIIDSLRKIKLEQGNNVNMERNETLVKTINDYFSKYTKQHKNNCNNNSNTNNISIGCQQVKSFCQKLMNKLQTSINTSSMKRKYSNLSMLLRQTEMLQKFGQSGKIGQYAKASQIQKYLDSLRTNRSISNNATTTATTVTSGNTGSVPSNHIIFNK